MIKKSSKTSKIYACFCIVFGRFTVYPMNHPTTILPKKYYQEYIGFTNTHRYADENDQNIQKIQNVRIFLHRFRPVYRVRIFMNHPQPRFSGLFPRFLLRGFLRLPIVDFEPSRAKITKARSTFQASSSREVKDGKISSPLLEFPKFW